jgi:hypothetical protein
MIDIRNYTIDKRLASILTIDLEDADRLAEIIQDNIIPSFKVKES